MTTQAEARSHFHTLTAAGWSLRSIAAHADIAASDLSRFMHGADLPHVATNIFRIAPGAMATRTNIPGADPFVSRVGTVRRIQALLRMGWRHSDLATHGGHPERLTANLLHQQGRWVTRSTHDAIADIYRDLSHQRGPSERTAARAAQRGYASPAEWDDIDRDEAPEPEEAHAS